MVVVAVTFNLQRTSSQNMTDQIGAHMAVDLQPGDKVMASVGYECSQSLLKRTDGSAVFKQGGIIYTLVAKTLPLYLYRSLR